MKKSAARSGDNEVTEAAGDAICKSAPPECAVFTNYGDEAIVKATIKRLARVPFKVSRLMEFCTRRELVNQTGHDVFEWPLVILKELTDNALDAAEEAEIRRCRFQSP